MDKLHLSSMNTKQRLFKPAEPAEPVNGKRIPLHHRQEYVAVHEELKEFEKLRAEKERAKKRLIARNRGELTKKTPTERAQALLAVGEVDPVAIHDRLAAVNAEINILDGAISEKYRELNAIASRLTYEEELKVKPAFNAKLAASYEKIAEGVALMWEAIGIPNALRADGYFPSSVTFPDVEPPGVRQLRMSGLDQFQRALVDRGAL